jgi:hypothetical protein
MRGYPTIDTPVKIIRHDYKGRPIVPPFEVRSNSPYGPGYVIYGHIDSGFAPNHIAEALRPDIPHQAHRHYNGRVIYGWRTKREAKQAMAKHLGSVVGGKRRHASAKPRTSRLGALVSDINRLTK